MYANKWTKAPWNICWATLDGRKVNFEITASPYGSVRPITGSRWKADWSEVEGDELIANALLIAAAPAMAEALEEVGEVLESLFRRSDESAQRLVRKVKDALALARGEDPK